VRHGLAALAVVCATTAPAALASPARAPSPAAATAAFQRLLHQRYGSVRGYSTCPDAQRVLGRIDCLAEVEASGRWHQVTALARLRNGQIVFRHLYAVAWMRHWWPYSRHFILRSQEPQVPGVVSVNSPAYDWGWLAMGADGVKAGHTRRVDAYDGYTSGFQRFYIFTCSRHGDLVTCRNALGDVMRYRPAG